jgi:hypothetical protein
MPAAQIGAVPHARRGRSAEAGTGTVEREGHRYEIWQLSTTAEGKRLVRRLTSAPTIGLARAAAGSLRSQLREDEIVIQDRERRHWFKP